MRSRFLVTSSEQTLNLEQFTSNDVLDRLMNWVVGTLLIAGIALLVAFQAHPPI